jgi:hypothetical protein
MLALRERERERERKSAQKKILLATMTTNQSAAHCILTSMKDCKKNKSAELSRNSSKFAARMLFRSLGTCEMKHEDLQVLGGSLEERESCLQFHHP